MTQTLTQTFAATVSLLLVAITWTPTLAMPSRDGQPLVAAASGTVRIVTLA